MQKIYSPREFRDPDLSVDTNGMKLSNVDIEKKLRSGAIKILPRIADENIGSMSVDLRLDTTFGVFQHTDHPFIDLGAQGVDYSMSDRLMKEIEIPEDGVFYLHPGELALGITVERVSIGDDIVGWLDGRSSLARLGLLVHVTAHTIDPGWDGKITLEFANIGRLPLALRPGMRICAISFEPLSSPTTKPYGKKAGAKYVSQAKPLASRISEEDDR